MASKERPDGRAPSTRRTLFPYTGGTMTGINYSRVLLGGLLAGVVINLGEFLLNGVFLMEHYTEMLALYNLEEASWAMGGYVFSAFILGLLVAWLYAAIRPRFGMGWKTGVIAGVAVWVAAYLVPTIWYAAVGLGGTAGITLFALAWGLVEVALAGVAGGWLYREGAVTGAAEPTVA